MDSVDTKRCALCGEVKSVEEFYPRTGKLHLRQSYCKPCLKRRSVENQAKARRARGARIQPKRLAVTDDGQKQCGRCRQFLPLTEFSASAGKVRARCHACKLIEQTEYRESHRDELRAAGRAYYAADPKAAKERIARSNAVNPEKYKTIRSAWKSENREAVNASTHKRRAALKNGGSWTAREWKALKARFGWHCLMCGRQAPEVTLCFDHVVPLDTGGPNVIGNGQPLDRQCNSKKHRQTLDLRSDSPYDTRPDLPLGSVDVAMSKMKSPERYHKRTAERAEKACSRCKRVLPIESFHFRSLVHGWRQSACPDCQRKAQRRSTPRQSTLL